MSILYDERIITDRWEYKKIEQENNYPTYILKDKKIDHSYRLPHIIGFEQVTDDEFLVYRRKDYNDFEFSRYKFDGLNPKEVFSTDITGYIQLTDDKLLLLTLDKGAEHRVKDVYSIENNSYVEEAKWLGWKTTVTQDKDMLIFHQEVRNLKEEVIFTLNYDTFEPNPIAYSTYRKEAVEVSSKDDIKRIVEEDLKCIQRDMENERIQHNEIVNNGIAKIKELSK